MVNPHDPRTDTSAPTETRGPRRPTPITPASLPKQTDTSKITIINRPRFTQIEALILNLLHNSHPKIVTIPEIARYIKPMCYVEPTDNTVSAHIVNLRAKIGEPKWEPRQIVSIWRKYKNAQGYVRLHRIGYRWVEPGEHFVDDPEAEADDDA